MIKLKKQSEKGDVAIKSSDSTNKTSQAVKIMAHLKDLDKMIKNGGKKEKKNKSFTNKKKKKLASVENQITSLKIISRIAGKVRDREVERQPFMDYSPDRHPHITTKNVDKLLYLETSTLAIGRSLARNNILHERETLQKMRGACIYIKAKLPGAVEKFKGKNELKTSYKDQKITEKKDSQTKYTDSGINKDKSNIDSVIERDRKIEIDVTTIHSILGLSGIELLGDIDTSDITRIRHKLIHMKESINSMIPEVSSDYVIKGLIKFDPNKLIGLVPMLLSVVKNKYVNPNFWASVIHELWLFLVVFQHNNLKIGDNSTESIIDSIKSSSKETEERLNKIHLFPDYFVAVSYLFSGMIDTKIPGVLRLLVRLNVMYYLECRINSLLLFCKSSTELWIDSVKLSALLNNIDSIRTLLTALSESNCIDMQQITLRIFTSNLVNIILYHLISSPIGLVNEKNNIKLIVCVIEFLNECLLIGHSKELLNIVSDNNFVDNSIINNVFGYGYMFYSELDANNIHLDKKEDLIVRDYNHNQYSYSTVGYYENSMNNKKLSENYNLWDIFSLVCNPKYSESILYPTILFLADIMYFSFVYEISLNYTSLKSLLISIRMLHKHFKKTTMEIGSDESLSSILLDDTKTIKKYLKLLLNSQNIDLKKAQEWITDRRIKESTLTRKLDESAKVPCFHPNCNNYTVGSKVKILVENDKSKSRKGEVEFRYCRGCFVVSYCSDKCQKSHWKLSHSTVCGLMSVPPKCLIFNSTVNWPIRLHLHNTKNRILETESLEYLQDKYYNNLYKHLSMRVFFDLSVLSVPYPLVVNDMNNNTEPYSCGLRECYRNDCLKYEGLKESGLRRIDESNNKLLVYRELHNNQKLILQIGDPRMWNSYLNINKEFNSGKHEKENLKKKKKIYLTKSLVNVYNIPSKHK